MKSANEKQAQDELRQQIIDAARERFQVYGYGKTTMAEIAQDLSMSAANLYRYFTNKEDIAVACANECMCMRVDALREAVRQVGLTASERLETFAITTLHINIEAVDNHSKINEIVALIAAKHKDVVHKKINAQCALIAEILSYGNETGEFDVKDVITTAQTVYTAFILFDVPLFASLYSKEEFEAMAKQVVNLLIKGLKPCNN